MYSSHVVINRASTSINNTPNIIQRDIISFNDFAHIFCRMNCPTFVRFLWDRNAAGGHIFT